MVGVRVMVDVRVGVSVGEAVLVHTVVYVCVSEGVFVAVQPGEATGEERMTGWITPPVMIKETQAISKRTTKIAIPKKREPATLCRCRSGQLAWRRLICMEWMPARKAKKAPTKPRRMKIIRPVRMPIEVIIA
jgi:hypothetical protein